MMFFLWSILEKVVIMSKYSPQKLKLRQEVLKILISRYGHEGNNKAIYECADEWVEKYVISAGVVDYYNAYKQSFINKSLEKN
tara:strand:+ start:19 stop:267 length:249 start_codon:yes stop_codon:yes gene_type:complete